MQRTHKLSRAVAATAATLAAAALTLSGCSVTGASDSGGDAGSGSGELNVLLMKQAGYSEDDSNQMIADFEAANPDIKVNVTYVAYEALHDKIVTSAPAGTYDVVLMDVIWPPEFADSGIVADVTDRIPASWNDEILGGALVTAKYNDRFYGVPWFPSTKLFYYNEGMVSAVGASVDDLQTWDGVLEVAKKIKEQEGVEYPLVWSWAQAEALICDYAQILGAFGGQFTDADGKLIINDKAGVEALTWMRQTIEDGLTNPASTTFLEDDVMKTMAAGQAAFSLNWEATLNSLNDSSISQVVDQVGVMQTPAGPTGDRPSVNGAMALAITSQSTNQDAAWKLIEFMTSQEVQEQFVTSAMPIWKASFQNPEVTQNNPAVFAAAGAAFDEGILRPQVRAYNEVSAILQVELQNALLGSKTPQQALDDAVAASNEILAK